MFDVKSDVPQWQTVYELLSGRDVGDVISYAAISDALGFDVLTARNPIYKAVEVLQREECRTVENVKHVGYRIVPASEHGSVCPWREH